jgi:Na+/proline symporter
MLPFVAHDSLWASQMCDVTRTWWAVMVTLAALPPLIGYLYRRRWQCTLRDLLLGVGILAVILGCIHSDFEAFDRYFADPYACLSHPGWEGVVPVLIISTLFTVAIIRSRESNDEKDTDS